jgi:hypothetical protein
MPTIFKTAKDSVTLHLVREEVEPGRHRAVVIAETKSGAYPADIYEAPSQKIADQMAYGTYGKKSFTKVVGDFSELGLSML